MLLTLFTLCLLPTTASASWMARCQVTAVAIDSHPDDTTTIVVFSSKRLPGSHPGADEACEEMNALTFDVPMKLQLGNRYLLEHTMSSHATAGSSVSWKRVVTKKKKMWLLRWLGL